MAKQKKKPQQAEAAPVDAKEMGAEQALIKSFNSKFGEGSIVKLSDDRISSVKEFIDTGSYMLNDIISHGRGWPMGRVVTITGRKSSGKSTLVAHLLAGAQKLGAITVLNDSECAFDEARAKVIGVDTDQLLMADPDHLEMALDQIQNIIEVSKATGRMIVIAWDSIAATPTKSEIENEIGGGGHYGEHAKVMSQGLRKLMKLVASNRVLLVLVNQVKDKIGAAAWEPKTSFIAQNPLEFGSHVMIEVGQCGTIKDNDDIPIGIMTRAKVTKNRLAPPFLTAELPIMFDIGIDRAMEALEIGKKYYRARLKGAWNQITKPCPDCQNTENVFNTGKLVISKGCLSCAGEGIIADSRYKQFYAKDIRFIIAENPELEAYLVRGTPIPTTVAAEVTVEV